MKRAGFVYAAPLTIGLLVVLAQTAATAETATAPKSDSQQVEQIVRQYILDHPEVVLESVRRYDQRQKEAEKERSREAVAQHQAELYKDAGSPAVESTRPGDDPVTLVEFFDYRCGYCRKVEDTVAQLAGKPGVRIVFKELPILGPESTIAAQAALAAQKQGGYQKFHHALLTSAAPVSPATIEQIAKDCGLDPSRLRKDMESQEIKAEIGRNSVLAEKLGVRATPTFVAGRNIVSGALTTEAFQTLIDGARQAQAATQSHPAGGL